MNTQKPTDVFNKAADNGEEDRLRYREEEGYFQREMRDRAGGQYHIGNGYMTKWSTGARRSEAALTGNRNHFARLILSDEITETSSFKNALNNLVDTTKQVALFIWTGSPRILQEAGASLKNSFNKAIDNIYTRIQKAGEALHDLKNKTLQITQQTLDKAGLSSLPQSVRAILPGQKDTDSPSLDPALSNDSIQNRFQLAANLPTEISSIQITAPHGPETTKPYSLNA